MSTAEMKSMATQLSQELDIPLTYIKDHRTDPQAFVVMVHENWLLDLSVNLNKPQEFVKSSELSDLECTQMLAQPSKVVRPWKLLSIQVIPKQNIPVAVFQKVQARFTDSNTKDLTYSHLLHYITETNFKNLWKDVFKNYSQVFNCDSCEEIPCRMQNFNDVIREGISRIYCSPIISTAGNRIEKSAVGNMVHDNVLPAYCTVESESAFYVMQPFIPHSLHDCLMFSSAVFGSSYCKPLFVVYQLLQVMSDIHDRGMFTADLSLHDIYLNPNLWISIQPRFWDALRREIKTNPETDASKQQSHPFKTKCHPRIDLGTRSSCLNTLVNEWVHGRLSNFDYLMALNRLAGRRIGNPNHHPVLPWVTDLSSSNGGWRDLSKSKFRLTKGDKQLDMMYETMPMNEFESVQVPHHVSDVLTDITYYVYMARRTPRSILCQHVRPNWVPAEYPSSMQRLQEWTPDECIPEFFTDPQVFVSIHDDLPDLELPSWAKNGADFVEKHRHALESDHVSERLHMWIDLTFGYRLSGTAAVKAKNICLHLVDQHTDLVNCGIVQLFTQPHPQRLVWGSSLTKHPPKLYRTIKELRKREKSSDDLTDNKENTENETTDFATKILTRQRSSKSLKVQQWSEQKLDVNIATQPIYLPKDFNPVASLSRLESMFNFTSKSVLRVASDEDSSHNPSILHVSHQRKIRDLISLGCLVVELFLPSRFRAVPTQITLEERFNLVVKILSIDFFELPRCVRSVVQLLLLTIDDRETKLKLDHQIDLPQRYPPISDQGLPPPSAHQLLEPLVTMFPFPPYFKKLYSFLSNIKSCKDRLDSCATNDSVGENAEELVKMTAKALPQLLPAISSEAISIIIPYLQEMFEDSRMNILSAWYLFDPLSQALGPQLTKKHFLTALVRIYDMDTFTVKSFKLFHRSYLLQLIVRFGLRVFLAHFVTRLIEAVGGFKDFASQDSDGKECLQTPRKTSHLHSPDLDPVTQETYETVLSPFDDRILPGGYENADETTQNDTAEIDETEPEIFQFDQAKSPIFNLSGNVDQQSSDSSDSTESASLDETTAEETTDISHPQEEPPAKTSTFLPIIQKPETEARTTLPKYVISDVAMESVDWLAHRLGPVLTAKYLSRNLLRMMGLCYYGQEQLIYVEHSTRESDVDVPLCSRRVVGDENVSKVFHCLTNIAVLYGEQIILLQYFPHVVDLVSSCAKRVTPNLEAGIIGSMMFLRQIIPYLMDKTLMDQLQDLLIRDILYPVIQLISSQRLTFPNRGQARQVIAYKLLDVLYVIGLRIGFEMTRKHLTVVLQRFFTSFDRVNKMSDISCESKVSKEMNSSVSIQLKINSSSFGFSPPVAELKTVPPAVSTEIYEELKGAFTPELAYAAYIPFCRLAGGIHMEQSLENDALIRHLCSKHDQELLTITENTDQSGKRDTNNEFLQYDEEHLVSGTFGKNVAMVGNRIDIKATEGTSACNDDLTAPVSEMQIGAATMISKKMENSRRHLRGSWLAYWEHEIGQNDKDPQFNFKQIKLQTFTGHTNSVRAVYCMDNEISFLSASKDKTVKLWSLRSHGDGTAHSSCHWTYPHHKKPVFAVTFVETLRLVGSCDGIVHLWDPFLGACVKQIDAAKNNVVSVLTSMPAPSPVLVMAINDSNIKFLDARTFKFIYDFKVSIGPAGLIRCLTVSSDGRWLAVGHTSGVISILDVRTGLVTGSWKGHEGEILQIQAFNRNTFVTTSLDHCVSVWNADDGKLQCVLRGPMEPIHCLKFYRNEMVSATTANRIGVHTSIDNEASFSSTRLRSDTFRGMVTSLTVLPLNRLLLLGADTGNLCLMC